MADRRVSKTVELKAGDHDVIDLGDLKEGELVKGFVKDVNHDKFLFIIVDEANCKRFMEGEEEAEEDESELQVLAEGDDRGHYKIEIEVGASGKHYLIVESEAAALKRTIKAELTISSPE